MKQLSYDCLGDLGCTREPRANRGVHVFERALPTHTFAIFFEKSFQDVLKNAVFVAFVWDSSVVLCARLNEAVSELWFSIAHSLTTDVYGLMCLMCYN